MTQQEFGRQLRNAIADHTNKHTMFDSDTVWLFGDEQWEAFRQMPTEMGLTIVITGKPDKDHQLLGWPVIRVYKKSYLKLCS